MMHDATAETNAQATGTLARQMRLQLARFLEPVRKRVAAKLDIRLLQTLLDLVQVVLTHRNRSVGLLLSELGGYLLGPDTAPAGAKRISNLLHTDDWSADDIDAVLWQQADERVQALEAAGDQPLLVWDGSVYEKPESQACKDLCVVRSSKARRLSRRRKGMTLPHTGPPILVPGLHWDGLAVVGKTGAACVAHMQWWSTRGSHTTSQRAVELGLLARSHQAWGRRVWHIWDRGYACGAWLQQAVETGIRFVVRWKKGNTLLDNWGEQRTAGAIGRGKRSQSHRMLRDPHTKQLCKVGIVWLPVNVPCEPQPVWLVIARLGKGREPWYLLSSQPVATVEQAWAVVEAYARRWQIELVWRCTKSELAFESPRVWKWEVRVKLLLLATLAYGFLLHLLSSCFDELRAVLLRRYCHRTGRRYQQVAAPLYRLRSALSRLWLTAAPPGLRPPGGRASLNPPCSAHSLSLLC